jgi:Uma2 family endonuclease
VVAELQSLTESRFLTVDQFLAQYGDDDRHELIDGEVFDLEPTGPHVRAASLQEMEVAAFVDRKLNVQIDNLALPYFVRQRGLLKPSGDLTAFRPDIMMVDRASLVDEPLWTSQSILTHGSSIKLIAEVVSTNWQNDYARKLEDYAVLGIPEFWIVDYAALGGERFIGRPKQSTLTLCQLVNGRYEEVQLRGSDRIISPTFPNLHLTAEQVFAAGQ